MPGKWEPASSQYFCKSATVLKNKAYFEHLSGDFFKCHSFMSTTYSPVDIIKTEKTEKGKNKMKVIWLIPEASGRRACAHPATFL